MVASRRLTLAVLALGVVIRIAALPLPGGGDVSSFKMWSYYSVREGVTRLYGVDSPPRDTLFSFAGVSADTDYPPLALYELALVGHAYSWATRGRFPDTTSLTIAVKALPVIFEAGFVLLAWAASRRLWGEAAARWVVIAYGLNPAVVLNGSVGGYLDALFVLPAAASLIAAVAGRPLLAGGLIAAAVLTKPQGLFIVPAVALALWNARGAFATLARAACGACAAAAVIVAPFVAAGTWRNMLFMLRMIGTHDAFLSVHAYNLWWLAGNLARTAALLRQGAGIDAAFSAQAIAYESASAHGFPHLKVVGAVLTVAAILWACWTARRAQDLALVSAVAAFSVQAYVTVGPMAHENHWYAASPLLVLAAAGRERFAPVLIVVTVMAAMNQLFWGFHLTPSTYFRLSPSYATIPLAGGAVWAFVWHAAVLRDECRTAAGPAPGPTPRGSQRA